MVTHIAIESMVQGVYEIRCDSGLGHDAIVFGTTYPHIAPNRHANRYGAQHSNWMQSNEATA